MVLFTFDGKRKYLTAEEQSRFMAAANAHERAEVHTFCLTLAHTGCRISEALELTPERVDLSDKSIAFRTLKKRDKVKYRSSSSSFMKSDKIFQLSVESSPQM